MHDLRVLFARIVDSSMKLVVSIDASLKVKELSWEEFKSLRGSEVINLSIFHFIDRNLKTLRDFENTEIPLERLWVGMLQRLSDNLLYEEIGREVEDEESYDNIMRPAAMKELWRRLCYAPYEHEFPGGLA